MPMIDVYASNDLLPSGSDRRIGEALTLAALRAEGVAAPSQYYLENTGVFIHRMDPATVQTAAEPLAKTVRMEGGWGIGGTAFGREEFTALAAALETEVRDAPADTRC